MTTDFASGPATTAPECLHISSKRAAGIGLKLVFSKVLHQVSLAIWHNPF